MILSYFGNSANEGNCKHVGTYLEGGLPETRDSLLIAYFLAEARMWNFNEPSLAKFCRLRRAQSL